MTAVELTAVDLLTELARRLRKREEADVALGAQRLSLDIDSARAALMRAATLHVIAEEIEYLVQDLRGPL